MRSFYISFGVNSNEKEGARVRGSGFSKYKTITNDRSAKNKPMIAVHLVLVTAFAFYFRHYEHFTLCTLFFLNPEP